ncbi:hypothetical protein SAMN05428948_2759 [Massilia sp. CF038]|nr:hypothetical protein SAMN05428948_2759 [Massilia sp. CF038]
MKTALAESGSRTVDVGKIQNASFDCNRQNGSF